MDYARKARSGPVWALGLFVRSVQCTNRDRTPQRDCLQTSRQRTDMGWRAGRITDQNRKKVNVVRAGVPVSARLHRLKSKTDTRVRYPLLFPNRHSYRFLRKYPFIHFGCAISFYIERPLMQRRLLRFVSRQTSAIFPLPLLSLISLAG